MPTVAAALVVFSASVTIKYHTCMLLQISFAEILPDILKIFQQHSE